MIWILCFSFTGSGRLECHLRKDFLFLPLMASLWTTIGRGGKPVRPLTGDVSTVVTTVVGVGEGSVGGRLARAGATGGDSSAGVGGVAGGGGVTAPPAGGGRPHDVRGGAGGGGVAAPSASGSGPRDVGAGGGGVAAPPAGGGGPRAGFVKPVFRTLDVNVPRGAGLSRADLVAFFVSRGLLSSVEAVVMTRFGHQVTFTSHGVMAQFSGGIVVGVMGGGGGGLHARSTLWRRWGRLGV